MADINMLAAPQYPTFQPPQQTNPLAMISQVNQIGLQDQALQQGQANLGIQRVQAVNNMLGTLITKPDLSYSDVTGKLDDMVRNKIIPPDEKPAILQHLQGVANDPEALRGMLKNSYIQTLDHVNKMGMGFGVQTPVGVGGGTQFGATNPMQPGRPQFGGGTFVPNAPDPSKIVPGPVVRSSTTGAPTPTALPEDVAVGIARGSIGYDVGPNGQLTLKKPSGTVGLATVPVGAGEAAGVSAKGGAEMGTSIERTSAGAPTRTAMLNNLEDDLKKFDSGPLAGYSLTAKRLVNDAITRTGVPVPQWDPQSVGAQENFNKQATQLAQQQFTSLGGTGTDQQLGSAFKANPNDALSPMGNKQIISLLKGNEDALRTMNDEWQKWKTKNGSETGGQFMTWFNGNYSPRAFQFARMSKPDRAELLQNMKPEEKAALGDALKNAEKRGWINPD